jgi:hypothetical protein
MPTTTQRKTDAKPEQQDEGSSTLVPMLIAGLILIVIGYAVIMLFV